MDVVRAVASPLWTTAIGDDHIVHLQGVYSTRLQRGKNLTVTADTDIEEIGSVLGRQKWT